MGAAQSIEQRSTASKKLAAELSLTHERESTWLLDLGAEAHAWLGGSVQKLR